MGGKGSFFLGGFLLRREGLHFEVFWFVYTCQ